jgi:Methyltransferase FkbM domain
MLHKVSDDIAGYGRKVYSQGDEDGVIAEIFRRVGVTNKTFIEFGAGSGWENNTRCLLEQGWRGLWIEAEHCYANRVRCYFRRPLRAGRLTFIEAAVTTENINELIFSCGFPADIDFLSIDIDGNDYHVLEAITAVRPRVICLEYNTSKSPPIDWVMPYDPTYRHQGDGDYGASLVAFERLGRSKGFTLVGTARYSVNAFFVRDDLVAGRFDGPFTANRFFHASTYEEIVAHPADLPLLRRILRKCRIQLAHLRQAAGMLPRPSKIGTGDGGPSERD